MSSREPVSGCLLYADTLYVTTNSACLNREIIDERGWYGFQEPRFLEYRSLAYHCNFLENRCQRGKLVIFKYFMGMKIDGKLINLPFSRLATLVEVRVIRIFLISPCSVCSFPSFSSTAWTWVLWNRKTHSILKDFGIQIFIVKEHEPLVAVLQKCLQVSGMITFPLFFFNQYLTDISKRAR